MTFSEITDKLFATKGIHEAFAHQCETFEEYRSTRVSGGGWNHAHQRGRHFRVGIKTDKGQYAESEKPTITEALTDSFTRAGMTVPTWVKDTASFEKDAKSWGGTNQ